MWLTNQTPVSWPSDFVNDSYDYRLNWTPPGPIISNIQATISAFWLVKNMSVNPKLVQFCKVADKS